MLLQADRQTFSLCPLSPRLQGSFFFRKILGLDTEPDTVTPTAKFKHGDNVVVNLPEIDVPNFKLYVAWISDSQLDYHQIQPHLSKAATNTSSRIPYFVSRYSKRAIIPISKEEFDHL